MVAHWIDCICWFSLCFLDQVMACQFKALLCIEVYWIKKQPIDSKGHVPWRHVRHLGKLLGGNSPKVANLLSHTNDNDNGNPLSAASKDLWPGSFEERSLRKKVIDFVKKKERVKGFSSRIFTSFDLFRRLFGPTQLSNFRQNSTKHAYLLGSTCLFGSQMQATMKQNIWLRLGLM